MTFHNYSWIGLPLRLIGVAGFVLLPAMVLLAQETAMPGRARISYTLGRAEISVGEPVDVIVRFENLGANDLDLETGDNGVGNFVWTVASPDGKPVEYPYHPPSGDTASFPFPVLGRGTARLQLILDERTPFREPGRYILTIRHLPSGSEGSLSLLVEPRNEQKLTERCRQLVRDLKDARDESERAILLGRLCAFHDPVAVPFILEGVKSSQSPNDFAMVSLAKFDTPDAIQAMLDILDRTKGSSHNHAWSLTYGQAVRIKDTARREQILARLLRECTTAPEHPSGCPAPPVQQR
ncbi:hypothetical protein [Paludibaculum fermentans]|uniref:Uncharacterized protein n=1 Tax=Paludibaculum fermentans TaxID=1473598 RepID=A0A7S7NNR0_PALFE|nr:hypothetical protein [Paludibaculum fermentans]QOY86986.1 hypothetical protein IRI77_30090 [Paludibaculum fermentans]